MKCIITFLSILSLVAAFAPAPSGRQGSVSLNAQVQSRKAFFTTAAASVFGAAQVAQAMDQELVTTPTEQWETGSPTADAAKSRKDRFSQSRNQLTSNFAPIKRLTLERKSPVTRLDINSPWFGAYKSTYPGLYKEVKTN